MTRFWILLLLMFCVKLSGQDLKGLEQDLSETPISDMKSVKEKATRIFKIDPFNQVATFYLIEAYRFNDNDSLIHGFFRNQKQIAPANPKPYLLSAKYQYRELSLNDTLSLMELKTALTLDKENLEANHLLGISYYNLFHERICQNPSIIPLYYAKSSRKYLLKTIEIDSQSLESLKYPIIQLSYIINDTAILNNINRIQSNNRYLFPIDVFAELPVDWKINYVIDVLQIIDQTKFLLEWYSKQLFALQEPIIFNQKGKRIYRLTWLRTFHNPVAIRIENEDNNCKLYWKVSDGHGGYDPGELIVNKTEEITLDKWETFISLLESINFWQMPTNEKEILGTDGSQWILEGIENGKYHVVDRWTPTDSQYQKCGKYLIDLTNIKISQKDFY